jgi:cobalt-precorrin-5B (C1)-methyltransferase
VVRPFSCSAWIASIHRGIDVARANDLPHVMGSTGATSEGWGRERTPAGYRPDRYGGFCRRDAEIYAPAPGSQPVDPWRFRKMVKMAQGASDLHSARSQVDFAALADDGGPVRFRP